MKAAGMKAVGAKAAGMLLAPSLWAAHCKLIAWVYVTPVLLWAALSPSAAIVAWERLRAPVAALNVATGDPVHACSPLVEAEHASQKQKEE
jgi:hypothetical protein